MGLSCSTLLFGALLAASAPAAAQLSPATAAPYPPPGAARVGVAPATVPPAATAAVPGAPQFERDEDAPLAGYTNGQVFIRSRDSNFVLFPSGRLNVDSYFYLNRGEPPEGVEPDGPSDQRPRHTIFVRRARAEIMGTILKHFDYMLAGEFASIPILFQSATISDVFVNVNYTPWANIQIGQFDAPFTLENRTADKYIDFMERSITVRSVGVPSNKEIGLMLHGLSPNRALRYEAGVFNGDGGNVRNPDSHFDFITRAYFAPLALLPQAKGTRWLSEIWLGASFWYGRRVDVPYDIFPLSTNGGVSILPPLFGSSYRQVSNGDLLKWAFELNVPVGPLGWRFELVRVEHEQIGIFRPAATDAERALPLSRVLAGNVDRTATSFYVQMWYWLYGKPTMLPTPGQDLPPRWGGYIKGRESYPIGVYVTARYERMVMQQKEIPDENLVLTDAQKAIVGNITMDSFGAALNVWATKHVRGSVNYFMNYLDGDMPLIQGNVKIPTAGPLMQPTYTFYRKAEHELLFRVAISL